MNKPPHNVCILRLSAVGDICHTLPVVRTLQDHWPETHITWVIGRLEHSLIGDIPGIEFMVFDKKQGLAAYSRLRQQLRGRKFDLLLNMQVALRASIASLFVHAPVKLGYDKTRARDWQWLFTNQRIAARKREHVMDALFGFTDALGIPHGRPRWDIPLSDEDLEFARQVIPGGKPALVISPCSSQRARNFRNWPVERYIAVADHAMKQLNMSVVLTGGPSALEREYGELIENALPDVHNLIGKTNLKQLFAILSKARVLISPDSGPAHMANAAGTPVIGLYATSNPERTGPYNNREYVVNRYPDAVKKYLGKSVEDIRWGQRVRAPDAMLLITEEDVIGRLNLCLTSRRQELA